MLPAVLRWDGKGGLLLASVGSVLVLWLVSVLPLEASLTHALAPVLFLVKIALASLVIALTCVACGNGLLTALQGIGRRLLPLFPHLSSEEEREFFPLGFWGTLWSVLFSGLIGLLTLGLAVFVYGQFFTLRSPFPHFIFMLIVVASPWLMVWPQGVLFKPLHLLYQERRVYFRRFTQGRWWERGAIGVVLVFLLFRGLNALKLASHGDGYLYHLSVAEAWLRTGTSGVYLSNIYSGYALCVEHFYLLLRILVPGQAEQTVLAQVFHPLFGLGTAVVALVCLARKHLCTLGAAALALALFHYDFSYAAFHPKNDGFLAGILISAMVALIDSRYLIFIAAALFGLTVKPTGAMTFLALGLVMLAKPVIFGKGAEFLKVGGVLSVGVVVMVVAWLPFAAFNHIATGNPFFPLFNGFFGSPFGPADLSQVVREMRPFQTDVRVYLKSFVELVRFQSVFALVPLAIGLAFYKRRSHPLGLSLAPFLWLLACGVMSFLVIQVLAGPYEHSFTSRHYLTVLMPLVTFALVTLWNGFQGRFLRPLFRTGIVVFALSGTMFEVLVRDVVRYFKVANHTAEFLEKHPQMALNHEIELWLATQKSEVPPQILSVAYENKPYFLESADFCHINFCWPAWSWNIRSLTSTEIFTRLKAGSWKWVIVGDDENRALREKVLALPHRVLLSVKEYSLVEIDGI